MFSKMESKIVGNNGLWIPKTESIGLQSPSDQLDTKSKFAALNEILLQGCFLLSQTLLQLKFKICQLHIGHLTFYYLLFSFLITIIMAATRNLSNFPCSFRYPLLYQSQMYMFYLRKIYMGLSLNMRLTNKMLPAH